MQTPLHLAVDMAFEEAIYIFDTQSKFVEPKMNMIQILLENGANASQKDNKGNTAFDWAKER